MLYKAVNYEKAIYMGEIAHNSPNLTRGIFNKKLPHYVINTLYLSYEYIIILFLEKYQYFLKAKQLDGKSPF